MALDLCVLSGAESGTSIETIATSGTVDLAYATAKKSGSYSFRVDTNTAGAGTDTAYIDIGKWGNGDEAYTGNRSSLSTTQRQVVTFWFNAQVLPTSGSEQLFASVDNATGSAQYALAITSAGKLQMFDGDTSGTQVGSNSTATLSAGTWYHIEVVSDANANTGAVYIDGSSDITGSCTVSTASCDRFRFGKAIDTSSQKVDFCYDDITAWEDGTTDITQRGKIQLASSMPTGDGYASAWTGGTGSTYAEIDEASSDDATTYLQSTAATDHSAVTFPTSSTMGISGTISALAFWRRSSRSSIGAKLEHFVRISGTNYYTGIISTEASTWTTRGSHRITSPATSSAWTTTEIDGLQAGMEEDTTSTNRGRWSWERLYVAYIPSGATNYTITASGGSYTITGTAASLLRKSVVSATSGSYSISGTNASLEYNRLVAAGSGTYTISGTTASLLNHKVLTADSGSYVISGTDATLTYSASGNKTIISAGGTYIITGSDAALEFNRLVSAGSGSYTISGSSAALSKGVIFAVDSGTYSISGTAAAFLRDRIFTVDSGSYTITGKNATLTYTPLGTGRSQYWRSVFQEYVSIDWGLDLQTIFDDKKVELKALKEENKELKQQIIVKRQDKTDYTALQSIIDNNNKKIEYLVELIKIIGEYIKNTPNYYDRFIYFKKPAKTIEEPILFIEDEVTKEKRRKLNFMKVVSILEALGEL